MTYETELLDMYRGKLGFRVYLQWVPQTTKTTNLNEQLGFLTYNVSTVDRAVEWVYVQLCKRGVWTPNIRTLHTLADSTYFETSFRIRDFITNELYDLSGEIIREAKIPEFMEWVKAIRKRPANSYYDHHQQDRENEPGGLLKYGVVVAQRPKIVDDQYQYFNSYYPHRVTSKLAQRETSQMREHLER